MIKWQTEPARFGGELEAQCQNGIEANSELGYQSLFFFFSILQPQMMLTGPVTEWHTELLESRSAASFQSILFGTVFRCFCLRHFFDILLPRSHRVDPNTARQAEAVGSLDYRRPN